MTAAYLATLATGSTTRARCWRLKRRDGVRLGFTDHDKPLSFGGTDYEPATALAPSESASSLGLAPDDLDVAGALSSDGVTEEDIARGLYDGAEVTVFDVDWTSTGDRVTVGVYVLGEVERSDGVFKAEIRSRTAGLSRKIGRHILPVCDAEVGDARCGVDASGSPFKRSSAVVAAAPDGVTFRAHGPDGPADGFFVRGVLAWTSGANAGSTSVVRDDYRTGAQRIYSLWRKPPRPIEAGDAFDVVAGCSKTWSDCVVKFANGANFRGFPHVPSETFPATTAKRRNSAKQDGRTGNRQPTKPAPVFQGRDDGGSGGDF
ncbi:MAG: DUF2163 domain-containing protein [Pseudomonadota bacterium]